MLTHRWQALAESQYPWEQDALLYVRERLPDREWVWAAHGTGISAVYDRKGFPKRGLEWWFAFGWQVTISRNKAGLSDAHNPRVHL